MLLSGRTSAVLGVDKPSSETWSSLFAVPLSSAKRTRPMAGGEDDDVWHWDELSAFAFSYGDV